LEAVSGIPSPWQAPLAAAYASIGSFAPARRWPSRGNGRRDPE